MHVTNAPRKIRSTAKKPKSSAAVNKPAGLTRARRLERMVTPEKRHRMIAEAAYYRAERRNFCGGEEESLRDWLEAEIDRLLLGSL